MTDPIRTFVQQMHCCVPDVRASAVRTQKIQTMLVRKALLEGLPEDEPKFETDSHATRWGTLQQMLKLWQEKPEQFLRIELCF